MSPRAMIVPVQVFEGEQFINDRAHARRRVQIEEMIGRRERCVGLGTRLHQLAGEVERGEHDEPTLDLILDFLGAMPRMR